MAICAPSRSMSSMASAPATDGLVDDALLVLAGMGEHEVDDLVLHAGVAHPDTQPPEAIALRGNEVAQAIVPAVHRRPP